MTPQAIARLIGIAVIVFVIIIVASTSSYVVQPGYRGVQVTLGKVSPVFKPEGFGLKTPFITTILPISVRQQTKPMPAECYSSDLQQVKTELRVLYRIPEGSVVRIFQDYAGDPFDSLISPRVNEALKEVTALHSAEMIVKKREEIKTKALESARQKVGAILIVEDIVLQDITLTHELGRQKKRHRKYVGTAGKAFAQTFFLGKGISHGVSLTIRGERARRLRPALCNAHAKSKRPGSRFRVPGICCLRLPRVSPQHTTNTNVVK